MAEIFFVNVMKFFRLLAFGSFMLTTLLPGAPIHVKASLVAAEKSLQPGRPVAVALRLVHDPHWHTYWSNPGIGLATSLAWTLPPGFKAGEIQWPAPLLLKNRQGDVVGNGYEGDLLLPLTLTPPADLKPGTIIELKARANWLMCEEVCIPGGADVTLVLPVSAEAPSADPEWANKIHAVIAGLPRPDPSWAVSASRNAETLTLTITPSGQRPAPASSPNDLHFFDDDGLVAYDLPQTSKVEGGRFILTAQIAKDAQKNTGQLHGVLTSENGWLPGNSLRGLRIDVPLATAAGPVALSAVGLAKVDAVTARPATGPIMTPRGSLAGTLVLAFIGGLILNLMPCVFPVLGLKILGFVNQAGSDRGKVAAHGLLFALGVLLSFWTLAGALAVLRAGGSQLGWGFQLQSPAFVFSLAALLLVFATNLSGVFEFGLRATAIGGQLQTKSGYTGSFFTGVLATVVATPCSAPFLAPALGAALALSTFQSFVIFTTIAVGLATPYLLLSLFPQAVTVLPRPGAWMETFKQFMAFPLYATVAYLVWVLAGQTSEDGFQNVLFGLVLIALGVWCYGHWRTPGASSARARFGLVGLLLCGAAGLWLGWPSAAPAVPSPGNAAEIVWEKWSPEAVAIARAEGRIIYVDFTARWCATCQANKKIVFHNAGILRVFADKKIVTLRGDWTNQDPAITRELARYRRSAVPFNLVWLPGRNEPVLLPELLTPGTVLEAVNRK